MANLIQIILKLLTSVFNSGAASKPAPTRIETNTKGQPTRIENIEHIKKWEGLRLKAYMPTAHDKWTIGYGHTGTAKEGMVITEAKAEKLLRKDLEWVRKAIKDLVEVPLSQNQYDALAGLIFNIGRTNFANSTVLRRLNASDMEGAANAFLMWDKQRQNGELVVLRGLVRRRKDEKEMFLNGTT